MKHWFLPAIFTTATLVLSACGSSINNNDNNDIVTPPPAQSPRPEGAIGCLLITDKRS
ncbi:MAG: hypothetical protein ACR2QU_05675 [Gammaproteobacteria bacterium]